MSEEKRKAFRINARLEERLDELVGAGFSNHSEAIRASIMMMHNTLHSNEKIEVKSLKKQGRPRKSKQQQKEDEKAEKRKLCKDLNGEVKNNTCEYYVYSQRDHFKQEVPLSTLSQGHKDRQFDPDKETIIELQEEDKVNYQLENDPFYNARQD